MPGEHAMDKIIRINPLLEALRSAPERVNKVFVQEERGHARIGEVIHEAKAHHVPVVFVPAKRLDVIAPGHQGVMAEVSPKKYATLEDILARSPKPFVVILDEVEDPQNLGAIVRSAEGAGADGLILPERRSAGLTETVDTVSAGALEHLPVARVTNLVRAMEELKEKGLWLVGAEGSGDDLWPARSAPSTWPPPPRFSSSRSSANAGDNRAKVSATTRNRGRGWRLKEHQR
jgi:23S rRNA (guanosine2251-2'-O)-methyltransferase